MQFGGIFAMGSINRKSNRHLNPKSQKSGLSSDYTGLLSQFGKHDAIVSSTADAIAENPEKFKETLVLATTDYKKRIENEWFRNDGKKRADQLIQEVKESKSHHEVVKALSKTIMEGNENHDSLKTFLYLYVVENFCKNKKDELADLRKYSYMSYYHFLVGICNYPKNVAPQIKTYHIKV